MFGDILLTAASCHVLVAEEIAPYVCQHLTRIHLARVRVEPIPLEALRVPEPETEEETHSVASMRLDALIAAVWGEDSQSDRVNALQVLISYLRKVL